MSDSQSGGRADSPRRRARAAAAAAEAQPGHDPGPGSPGYPSGGYSSNYATSGYSTDQASSNGYTSNGYTSNGYNPNGYNSNGYNSNGYNGSDYTANGYTANGNGYGEYGVREASTAVPPEAGYSSPTASTANGYPINGYTTNGYTTNGYGGTGATGPYVQQVAVPPGSGSAVFGAYPAEGQASPYPVNGANGTRERSPYEVATPGASLYDAAATSPARSPYEDLAGAPSTGRVPVTHPPVVVPQPAEPPSPMNGSALRLPAYDRPTRQRPTGYDPGTRRRGPAGRDDQPGHLLGGADDSDLGDAWLGSSAPPSRRTSRSGGQDFDSPGGVPSGRSGRDRERDRESGRSSGVAGRLAASVGLDRRRDREESRRHEPETPLQAALSAGTEIFVVLGMALALSLVIKTFLVQAFFIPSQSMQNTLLVGDRVLVSKLTPKVFDLHRGDVIVFKDPKHWLPPQTKPEQGPIRSALTTALTFVGLLPQDSGEHLIKRVIGLPGDVVSCCDPQGRLMINGTPIDEPYIAPGNKPSNETFNAKVPPDSLWVMGDNRGASWDSRPNGPVPISKVVGKAFVKVWPFDRAGGIDSASQVYARLPDPPPNGAK